MNSGRPSNALPPPWWKTEDGAIALVIVSTCVAGWLFPERFVPFYLALLGMGLFFDIASLCLHLSTLITGRYQSGFPLVGLVFYVWFDVGYRKSLLAPEEARFTNLLLYPRPANPGVRSSAISAADVLSGAAGSLARAIANAARVLCLEINSPIRLNPSRSRPSSVA